MGASGSGREARCHRWLVIDAGLCRSGRARSTAWAETLWVGERGAGRQKVLGKPSTLGRQVRIGGDA
mgnify:CR=1 FL=1